MSTWTWMIAVAVMMMVLSFVLQRTIAEGESDNTPSSSSRQHHQDDNDAATTPPTSFVEVGASMQAHAQAQAQAEAQLSPEAAAEGVDPGIAAQFLLHHIKQRRTFTTGTLPPPSSVKVDLRHRHPPLSPCQCSLDFPMEKVSIESSSCKLPLSIWVSTATVDTRPMSERVRKDLSAMVGDVSQVRMVDVDGASFSCIDGRRPHTGVESHEIESRSLKAFGGDMGEFIMMLQVLQRNKQRGKLYESTVERLLKSWINTPNEANKRPVFYFHSDTDTLARIAASFGYGIEHVNTSFKDPLNLEKGGDLHGPPPSSIKAMKGHEDYQLPYLDFSNPPFHIQDALVQALSEPHNQGCAHLRLLMTYPSQYGVDPKLASWAIRAFFRILWIKSEAAGLTAGEPLYTKLKFVISAGKHDERMWINVKTSRECANVGVQPTFDSHASIAGWSKEDSAHAVADTQHGSTLPFNYDSNESMQISKRPHEAFIFHPQAVAHRREELAMFILRMEQTLTYSRVMVELMDLAEAAEERTQRLLIQGLPQYNVRIL